jgi:hypothetical protein
MSKITTNTISPTPIDRIQKQVGNIVMLAVESDGASFYVLGGSYEFFVPASHDNYAAMFSLLLAVQSRDHPVAVKYSTIGVIQQGNRRTVTALASGAHAVISGDSF